MTMMTCTRRTAVAAGLTASALVSLGACSLKGTSKKASSLLVSIGSNPPHFNPDVLGDPAVAYPGWAIYDALTLVTRDYDVKPALARSWEISEDRRTYTLALQDDVTWHDGEPFTSADVVWNLQEVAPLQPRVAPLVAAVEEVRATSSTEVVIQLKEPYAPLLQVLCRENFVILPKHIYEGTDVATAEANNKPIGTGPFRFKTFSSGQRVELERNPDYWGDRAPYERLVFVVQPDANTRTAALRTGEVDYIPEIYLPAAQAEQLTSEKSVTLAVTAHSRPTEVYLFPNVERSMLAAPDVRKALLTAINREEVVSTAWPGVGKPAERFIPVTWPWAADTTVDYGETYRFDPDAAARMLDEAGFEEADGVRLSLDLVYTTAVAGYEATAQVVKSNLAEIGVEVRLEGVDMQLFLDRVYTKRDFDLAVMSFTDGVDPSVGITRLYQCQPPGIPFVNPTGYCNEDLDAEFAQAVSAGTPSGRGAHYRKAAQLISRDLPALHLSSNQPKDAIRSDRWRNLDGYEMDGNWQSLTPR